MAKIGFPRLAVIFTSMTAATAAGLTLLGVLDSNIILGGAILAAIIALSFRLGTQYRGRQQA
jgi:hypothetical protein